MLHFSSKFFRQEEGLQPIFRQGGQLPLFYSTGHDVSGDYKNDILAAVVFNGVVG